MAFKSNVNEWSTSSARSTPSRELNVYDTGLNARCARAARKLVGNEFPDVSLLVFSHEDTDHIGGLTGFFRSFANIRRILRTGYDRSDETVKTWWRNSRRQGLTKTKTAPEGAVLVAGA